MIRVSGLHKVYEAAEWKTVRALARIDFEVVVSPATRKRSRDSPVRRRRSKAPGSPRASSYPSRPSPVANGRTYWAIGAAEYTGLWCVAVRLPVDRYDLGV